MNKPFARPAPAISYAEAPRLQRALLPLPHEDQVRFIALVNEHMASPRIKSLQRRENFLYITLISGESESVEVYDFGTASLVQGCLTALTDCLRTQRAPVQMLMPTNVARSDSQG